MKIKNYSNKRILLNKNFNDTQVLKIIINVNQLRQCQYGLLDAWKLFLFNFYVQLAV